MGGASVTSGKIEVKFPPQIKARSDPIEINTPPAFYPEIPGKKATMQPTIIIPEIIYPRKKKRIIVHHRMPLMQSYNNMIYGKVNPAFMQFAAANPYWNQFLQGNPSYKQISNNPNFKPGMAYYADATPTFSGSKTKLKRDLV